MWLVGSRGFSSSHETASDFAIASANEGLFVSEQMSINSSGFCKPLNSLTHVVMLSDPFPVVDENVTGSANHFASRVRTIDRPVRTVKIESRDTTGSSAVKSFVADAAKLVASGSIR
ncbi:hypothetical protein N7G274_001030 [Stereocaulon virgatum]|uniref:Uncharacterized protein n=1 Tax=Stereocaulon virgatum TaxID=373712 RepID=A0ABR4AQF9_9LECA